MDVSKWIKYQLDRLVAWLLLLLLCPFLLLIALAIRLDSPGNPLFLQERIGEGGRTFTIFKFRTMRRGSERNGLGATTARDDERITRLGNLLRKLSLDELPQLINIALGEMSFVGPRPTLRYQVEAYTPRQARRLLFRPGITGWAQVHGRNSIPWAERIEHDLDYIENHSMWLDAKTLWRTFIVLLRGDGVYAHGRANDSFAGPRGGAIASPTTPGAAAAQDADAESILVVGAGGHAQVVIDVIEKQGRYMVVGLLDEAAQHHGRQVLDYPILGGREVLGQAGVPRRAFVAIGSPGAREAWLTHLETLGYELPILIHPAAHVGRDVQIAAGTVLMAGAVVNSGARLGRGVIVNTGASIDHDCHIGDHAHIAPGARLAGGVRVGARSHIGIGACVIQAIEIGSDVVIGAGAAVVHPIPPHTTAVGVPARPLHPTSSTPQATPTPLQAEVRQA
ncbi:MAG: NeuD/PglB/VioB family sugar acetyltransferase [Candidatus Krumholzibacteriia bacterium]